MSMDKKSFVERLIEGYEIAKKPIAIIVMFAAAFLQSPLSEMLPQQFKDVSYPVVLVVLALILMQILFEIYEKIVKNEKRLNIIPSTQLYEALSDIVMNEKFISIKYIGIAGRHGWAPVLEKFFDENNPDSLIANRTKFEIEIALLNPDGPDPYRINGDYERFLSGTTVAKTIQSLSKDISKVAQSGSFLKLYFYQYMPNMIGFLINDNYLFVTQTFWEYNDEGERKFRAGGTAHFVYDKNDDYGGQEVIKKFAGWFDFIKEESEKADPSHSC